MGFAQSTLEPSFYRFGCPLYVLVAEGSWGELVEFEGNLNEVLRERKRCTRTTKSTPCSLPEDFGAWKSWGDNVTVQYLKVNDGIDLMHAGEFKSTLWGFI